MELTGKKNFRTFFAFAGIMGLVGVLGGLADIGISSVLGGADISTLPKEAVGRFAIYHASALEGLYKMDLLNVCMSLLTVPFFLGLAFAHRDQRPAFAMFTFSVAVIGTAVFVTNNAALPMLSLTRDYYAAADEARRQTIAAAGEALLSRGAHGSPGAFPGFVLSSFSSLLFSFLMLGGGIFAKPVALLGIVGNSIMILYLIVVTFLPDMERVAMFIVMIGGLAMMAWLVIGSIRLIALGRNHEKV
ncbi:MAG: hypothetical protein A2Y38_15355 [Spirochaetes bacterium GWB1_59_5]|nr:MAG: hypothetical protein A2Y38_15355 [Spirochaetes bacterium GWB1_59_5]